MSEEETDVKLEAKTSNQFVVFCKHLGRAHEKRTSPIFAPSKYVCMLLAEEGNRLPKLYGKLSCQ